MISKRYIVGLLMLGACFVHAQSVYEEEYRPQFHFSPESGWIGDPDGLIKYQNTYHLFWWGHAESNDLVHWQQQVYPMRGDDGTFSYYTGSVVVDKNNTSGFGDGVTPPMIAIYTAHNRSTGIQDQRISYSTDYKIFEYYSGNPVLNINSKEFRDPDVFWHEETNRWIMCITMPLDRRIDLYSSTDLKSWEFLSSFGPVGAREQVWEVPQLIQLPVEGSTEKKWVMICSMGPNKMQYFVGDFDGTNFILDVAESNFLKVGSGIEGDVFENFEAGFADWTVEGTAFGTSPAQGTLPDQTVVSGFLSDHLVNSYHGGDGATGKLTSKPFTIQKQNINFLIGGGNSSSTSINLVINGNVVRTASGTSSEALKWKGWNVSDLIGQEAQLVIVDTHTGGWGHVTVDHIMFSDVLMNTDREHARWIDWGSDFYAGRAFRDYDNPDSLPVVWLAWMGNWEYANQVPTTWGRGAESIPRGMSLHDSNEGYHLKQQPIAALDSLREEKVEITNRNIEGTYKLSEFEVLRNTYELEATFEVTGTNQNFGLNLYAGTTGRLVLGFDAAASAIYLDRRYVGNSGFSNLFPKISTAPIKHEGTVKFHVYVDQSSVEVFVNDGKLVFTSLVFPYSSSNGIEVFSSGGSTTLQNLKAWKLSSIWGVEPHSPVTGMQYEKKSSISVYPNPVTQSNELNIEVQNKQSGSKGYLVIHDGKGAILFRQNFSSDGSDVITISPNLNKGLYILEIVKDGERVIEKIFVK